MSEPITHGPVSEIAWKTCKCSKCGTVARCTPNFDFYVRTGDPSDGPLLCFACLCKDANMVPIKQAEIAEA